MLSRVFRIQRGEGRTVALVIAFMFLSVAGMTIGESGISALFFERAGPDSLPVIYLAQGAVGIVGMLMLSGVLGRFDRRHAYVGLPVFLVGVVALERAIIVGDPGWIYPALWLTTTLATLVQAVYLWGTAGLVTDTRRAKRLFPLFSAGNILGSVVGGLATRPLASTLGAENLLVVWAVALVGTSLLCATIVGVRRGQHVRVRSRRPSPIAELRQGFRFVRRSRLLVWMSIASVLFSVLYYSLYLPYAQLATARYPDPDALAGFFGLFWAGVTAMAFLVSVLVTNRLLGWLGAAAMILALPFLYAGAFAFLLVTSTFATLVAVRLGVNVWLQGVSSPAWETLTNVTPEDRRDQTRAFLNGGPTQIGTAIAGVVALVGEQALSPRQLSLIGLVTAVITVVVAWKIRASYTAALVDAIRAGRPRVFDEPVRNAPVAIRNEAQAVALATAALEDDDPRMRRLATHLLASADDVRAAGALRRAVRDPDPLVRVDAIAALARAGRLSAEEFQSGIHDDDGRVRLATVRALEPGQTSATLLHDDDPAVVAAAGVRLLDGASRREASRRLAALLSDGDAETRLAAVRELASARPADASAFASDLLDDPSPRVRAAAVEALASAGPRATVRAALDALASLDPVVGDAALRALDAVDLDGFEEQVRRVVEERSTQATTDGTTAASIPSTGEASDLLRETLLERARANALVALSAASVTSDDRRGVRVALDILREGDVSQLANALEAVEVALGVRRARALLALWEPRATHVQAANSESLDTAANDPDPFIRACAELVRSEAREGDIMPRSVRSMSPVELVLLLRRIALFAGLTPPELERIAAIAEERSFSDGDVIGAEGDLGDELHVILEGTTRVARADGTTIARRGNGDVVGEMSLITRSPRIATLIAEGDVRTVRIGHREFEGMVRERPDIALAIMRVLAERLTAASGGTTQE
jgi:HEAT repeat protein/predicted MFS family arabinose efflux permease